MYNLRVADFHTYFVGNVDWCYSAWSHNQKYGETGRGQRASKRTYARRLKPKEVDYHARRYAANTNKGKSTRWGKLTPEQQRGIKEHAVAQKYVNANLLHNNSLTTPTRARGYTLRDRGTGDILKYGETTKPGTTRYSKKYLKKHNADMFPEKKGTKLQMHAWQHKMIMEYVKQHGRRPPLNRNNY